MPSLESLTPEQKDNLVRAANDILSNPETNLEFKRLYKKANPKVNFPELQQEESVDKALKSRDEKIAALEAAQLERDVEARLAAKRALAEREGIDPAEVEAIIIERGKQGRVIDWESAMEIVKMQRQLAAATPAAATDRFTAPKDTPGIKDMLLSDDPASIARKIAHDTIDQLRGRRPAA